MPLADRSPIIGVMTAFISTSSLIGYRDLVTRLHGDAETLLRDHGIYPQDVAAPEGVIPLRRFMHLLEDSARDLGCDDFGLRLSEYQDLSILGPLAIAAANQSTARSGVQKIIDCIYQFSSGIRMRLSENGSPKMTQLNFGWTLNLPGPRHSSELAMAVLKNIIELLCGPDVAPESVYLEYDSPLPEDRYRNYFHAPVHLSCHSNALVFEARQLERDIDRKSPVLNEVMAQFVRDTIADIPDLVTCVEALTASLLPTLDCSLKLVAAQLGIHPRTLQRRLSAEQQPFEKLMDRVRQDKANRYLAVPDMPISVVAGLAGYSDQSSFNRACRRWFDSTPMGRRQQLFGTTEDSSSTSY